MANNTFRRTPVQYKQIVDDSKLFHINQFKGLQILDNPLISDYNSCYYCSNVYRNDTGTLTIRPRIVLDPNYYNINEALDILEYWYFDKTKTLFWYTESYLKASTNENIVSLFINGLMGCTMQIFEQTPYFLVSSNNILNFYKFTTDFSLVSPEKQNLPVISNIDPEIANYNILTNKIIKIEDKPFDYYPAVMKPDDRFERLAEDSFTGIAGQVEFCLINNNVCIIVELGTKIYVTIKGYDKSTGSFLSRKYDFGLTSTFNFQGNYDSWVGRENGPESVQTDPYTYYPMFYFAKYKVQDYQTTDGGSLVFLFGNLFGTKFKQFVISYGNIDNFWLSLPDNVINTSTEKDFNKPFCGPGLTTVKGNWSKTPWLGPQSDWWSKAGDSWGTGPWHLNRSAKQVTDKWNGVDWGSTGSEGGYPDFASYGRFNFVGGDPQNGRPILPEEPYNTPGKVYNDRTNTGFIGVVNSDLAVFVRASKLGSTELAEYSANIYENAKVIGEEDIICDVYSFSQNRIVSSFYLYQDGLNEGTRLKHNTGAYSSFFTSFVCGMAATNNAFMLRSVLTRRLSTSYGEDDRRYYYSYYKINNNLVTPVKLDKVERRHFNFFRGQYFGRFAFGTNGIIINDYKIVNDIWPLDFSILSNDGTLYTINIPSDIANKSIILGSLNFINRTLTLMTTENDITYIDQMDINLSGSISNHIRWNPKDSNIINGSDTISNKLALVINLIFDNKSWSLPDSVTQLSLKSLNIYANNEILTKTETTRPTDIVPYLNEIGSEIITSFFLDEFYWFITRDYIFGTGRGTIEFWDFAKYYKLDKPAIAAMRISDTSFWVFHSDGAYLIFKDTSGTTDSFGRGIWRITETAKAKPCYFKNGVTTLPISSYIATVTPDDISIIQLRKYVQTDERILVPITFKISALVREIIQNSTDIKIASYKYLTLFAFNQDNKCDILVFDNQTQDWWLWQFPVQKVYQLKSTDTNIEILFRTDNNTFKIYNFNEYEFEFIINKKKFNIYTDTLSESTDFDKLIPINWNWESALQSFGTLDLRKQLLRTNFTFTDFGEEADTGVEYSFNIFRRKFIRTTEVDSKTVVQMAKNKYNRTYITTFNFLQLKLANLKLEEHLEIGEKLQRMVKPKLASINFVYRLLPGIGPV